MTVGAQHREEFVGEEEEESSHQEAASTCARGFIACNNSVLFVVTKIPHSFSH